MTRCTGSALTRRERAPLVPLAGVREAFPETAPGLLAGSGRGGSGDLAGALQDRAGVRVRLEMIFSCWVPILPM